MELVHQPADSRQAQSEPARGGVTSDQRPRNVRDAGAFVTSHHHDALPGAVAEQFYDDLAVLRVEHDVAGQLRDGRCDERRLAGRESQERGQRAPLLARSDDVSVPVDRYSDLPRSVRYFLERGSFTRHGGSSRPLRRDWRGHVALDLRLREGAAVDPDLVDSPAEEVVIDGSQGPRADLQGSSDGTERSGLRRAAGSTVEVHAQGRTVRDDGHMVPALPGDRAAERALSRPVVEGNRTAISICVAG